MWKFLLCYLERETVQEMSMFQVPTINSNQHANFVGQGKLVAHKCAYIVILFLHLILTEQLTLIVQDCLQYQLCLHEDFRLRDLNVVCLRSKN